jgi:polysaccharide biosynthesis transport protein
MESNGSVHQARAHPAAHEEQGLSLADYFEILKRRRWLLIIPGILVFTVVAVVAALLPSKYESRATILIEQPDIQADLVRTTVSGYSHQQLQVIGQRVLSRTRLQELTTSWV